MSGWTHALCGLCYEMEEPGRQAVHLQHGDEEACCRCGELTRSGIYYRADPNRYVHCKHRDS